MIHQTIVDYLCNLINIDTTINSNNEIEGILYIKEVFDKIGIENKVYEPVSGKGNIIATIKGKSDDAIILHSHIDTANYNAENWLFPPYKATLINNCIVGRGTLDCKGLIAIWMDIMKYFYLNNCNGKELKNTLIFICSCDEEGDGKYGTDWLLNNTPVSNNIKLVFGEGGGYPIPLGEDIYFTIQTEEVYINKNSKIKNTSTNYTENKINEIFNKAIKLGYYNQNTLNFYNNRQLQNKRKIAQECFYENIDIILENKEVDILCDYNKKIFTIIENKLYNINPKYKLLPIITPGYSDNRYFRQRGIPAIGFFPLDIKNNTSGIHGNNEYISFKSLTLSHDVLLQTLKILLY